MTAAAALDTLVAAPTRWRGATRLMMGGRVDVRIAEARANAGKASAGRASGLPSGEVAPLLDREADRVLERIEAWAGRLTRFDSRSELSRLEADPRAAIPIGPTLAAVLDWGRAAEVATEGLVDVTLLDARVAAELGTDAVVPAHRRWSLERRGRGAIVRRSPGARFDLDGVAKGWLADRALALVGRPASALVDADGDIAVRLEAGEGAAIGVSDPRADGRLLATIALPAPPRGTVGYGVATSGTSVHRWDGGGAPRHHLIDPRTRRPAVTDVVQATVVASTARHAEAFAKAIAIAGLGPGIHLLRSWGAVGALVLTDGGDVLAVGRLAGWLV